MVWDGRELRLGLSRSRETGHFQDCSAVMLEWFPCQKKKSYFPHPGGEVRGLRGEGQGYNSPDTAPLPRRPG